MVTVERLQTYIGTAPDGDWGEKSRAQLCRYFTNTKAPAVTDAELEAFAKRLGGTKKQVAAVGQVESSGGGFDKIGRPKILFERHKFWELTKGKFAVSIFNNPKAGGYDADSWNKLCLAVRFDPDAAFASCSWGKFQVMGMHWKKLGFNSSLDLAEHTIDSEANHYDLLVRYIEVFGLKAAFTALSNNPEMNRAFAKGYNGPRYEDYQYHLKLAKAMT